MSHPCWMCFPVGVNGPSADAVHSRTSYSKATPSGSFCSNHVSAASALSKTFNWSLSPDLLVRIDVDPDGTHELGPTILFTLRLFGI